MTPHGLIPPQCGAPPTAPPTDVLPLRRGRLLPRPGGWYFLLPLDFHAIFTIGRCPGFPVFQNDMSTCLGFPDCFESLYAFFTLHPGVCHFPRICAVLFDRSEGRGGDDILFITLFHGMHSPPPSIPFPFPHSPSGHRPAHPSVIPLPSFIIRTVCLWRVKAHSIRSTTFRSASENLRLRATGICL